MNTDAALTRDAFVGGKLHLWQPKDGYRAGVDPVLLAACVRAQPGQSVLDVGCGQGAWLSVWKNLGVQDVTGIDGNYVNRESLLISEDSFVPCNLAEGFELGQRFDLVQSLEVAEHLPAESASTFVNSLVKHGDLVLFSAAPKGQGGDSHINEQDYDYWRTLFAEHNYVAIDYLRPLAMSEKAIEPWYRYNTFLYASSDRFKKLPKAIQLNRVPDNKKLHDLSPPIYKIRKRLVSLLPIPIMTRIAKIKEHQVAKARKQ